MKLVPAAGISATFRQNVWWITSVVPLVIVALTWCYAYNRWTNAAWTTPISYGGDAWGTLGGIKAMATGEIAPILPKYPRSLGAPFAANWNDYPIVEEGSLAWLALLGWIFGLFAGANAGVLSAHLLATGSFLFVCRALRYHPIFSGVGAILFGLSRFIFSRSLPHITVALCWHVPLLLLVIYWCTRADAFADRRKRWFCLAVAVVCGVQNVYYTGIFLQFLAGAALFNLLRRMPWRQVLFPVAVSAAVVGTFVLMNFDTFFVRSKLGPNSYVVVRAYADVELYALKPIELVLPMAHRFEPLAAWVRAVYLQKAHVLGEPGSQYLGIIGIGSLALLLWSAARGYATRNFERIPAHLWPILWVLAFSVVGGINGLLGTFGIVFFRSSNRYSIVILALLLLFLVRELSRVGRNWRWPRTTGVALALLIVGIWDQVPKPVPRAVIESVRRTMKRDAALTTQMEERLPSGAMIFQLPVMDYPEVPATLGVSDYEQFRPYFFSRDLRFSYGSHKGRGREYWQRQAEKLAPPEMVELLERYGFSAVLIQRHGYADGAAALMAGLAGAGRDVVLAQRGEFTCIALNPSPQPELPGKKRRAQAE